MKSIPELAEKIRQHINTDNDAKRLIVEHILPLLGADFGSLAEMVNAPDRIGEMEDSILDAKKEVRNAVATLDEIITDRRNDNDEDCPVAERLEKLRDNLDNTVKSYLTLSP